MQGALVTAGEKFPAGSDRKCVVQWCWVVGWKGWTRVGHLVLPCPVVSNGRPRRANRYRRLLPPALALAQRAFASAESLARAARAQFSPLRPWLIVVRLRF